VVGTTGWLQLTTVRWLGTFLPDPLDVPAVVLEYVAGRLAVDDLSGLERYLERRPTRFDHAAEIEAACGLREFAQIQRDFELWLDARAWMTGDGPRAIFGDAIGWLRERDVLLAGVTTLARLVARARAETDERLREVLSRVPSVEQAPVLDLLLEVPDGARVSGLERWRRGPAEPSGKNLRLALARVAEIHGVGIDAEAVRALVPTGRLVDVARYGMAAKAPALRRHPTARRLATLVATVVHLSAGSIDDCLELFDVLMVTELLGRARRETEKQRASQHRRLARASATLAAAVRVLLEASASGEALQLADVWRSIELVVPRAELGAAVATVRELVPNVDMDDEGEMRARLAERIRLVSGFIGPLCEVIEFGANAEGAAGLAEMRRMPQLLAARRLKAADIDGRLVHGSWRRLV